MSEGVTTVVGIDPGLVDNGVVVLRFYPGLKQVEVKHAVITGAGKPDETAIAVVQWVADEIGWTEVDHVFVEDYIERGTSYGTNPKMRELIAAIRREVPYATFVNNTGVKKVVRKKLLDLFGIWKFDTTTHHQDLEAASRILLYGMLKDEELNALVADVVLAHIVREPWSVTHE